jgi:predicted esterase
MLISAQKLATRFLAFLVVTHTLIAAPAFPETSGTVSIPAQEWPLKPGPREIVVTIRYPGVGAKIGDVTEATGLMLSLHNWGGTGSGGSADPGTLARKYNVVAIGVDYLQSGAQASIHDPEPYDFGWLQGLDALRALHFVFEGLKARGAAFDSTRIFATGGSGGGNVSLMANKLAPRTFAVVIDMCGMKKLSDDIAFNEPGGSSLNARYSRDPASPFHLTRDAQDLRFLGLPAHLATMKRLGCPAKIISVHGSEDTTCPFADAQEYAAGMTAGGLDFTFVPVTKEMLDGKVFTSTGHALGNRTAIVEQVAGRFLDPQSPEAVHRRGATDFERKEDIRYPTMNGEWIVSYAQGFPVGRFEPRAGQ